MEKVASEDKAKREIKENGFGWKEAENKIGKKVTYKFNGEGLLPGDIGIVTEVQGAALPFGGKGKIWVCVLFKNPKRYKKKKKNRTIELSLTKEEYVYYLEEI